MTDDDVIREYAQKKRLSRHIVERWRAWEERDRRALLEWAVDLEMGENHLREVMEWLEEIVLRDGGTIAAVMEREEIGRIRRQGLSRNDRLREIKGALRKIRYPRLARLEDQLREAVKEMDLGRCVRVRFPAFLEGDEVTVEIRARNIAELREGVSRLWDKIQKGYGERIFTLLGSGDQGK